MNNRLTRQGNIVDVVAGRIFPGTITIEDGKILSIKEEPVSETKYILPGLVDAHIHVESSMLIPSEFARLAVVHGTVATVSDPHEIANVLGIPGIKFMIANGSKVPFKFYFGASSCVPATPFETAGSKLSATEVAELLSMKEIHYLSEMMNFPGVLNQDPEVMAKIEAAKRLGKPVDGHAPGLRGEDAGKYIAAGISTDHECFTREEALDKLRFGMKILIREGSAARNFEALCNLIDEYPDQVMLCSDDKHPNDLRDGHINELIIRALDKGFNFMNIIRSCTANPVNHYRLDVGLLQPGDSADFIVVDDLEHFTVLETFIRGIRVAVEGKSLISSVTENPVNRFDTDIVKPRDLAVPAKAGQIRILEAIDGQLITLDVHEKACEEDNLIVTDTKRDILKLVVKNRYAPSKPAIGFIRGFGLKSGAIASCVAHDSHNIVAVGVDDEKITKAINLIISNKGGISLVDGSEEMVLPLPYAGIMTDQNGYQVAEEYALMDLHAKKMGSGLRAPYMTLSFMALLVIPELKLSDQGLFDGKNFSFTSLFC